MTSSRMLMIVLIAAAVCVAGAGVGAGAEWHVYQGAGTPIQDAINTSHPGDTIYVHAGLYYENLNVGKRLTLIGEGTDVVTVTAASASADDDVFEVFADYVNISGFTVTGATQGSGVGAGICLFYAEHCNISNNNISNNSCGIYMEDTSNNMLRNNTISGNGWNFGVFGKSLSHYIHDIDTSNTVNGLSFHYL